MTNWLMARLEGLTRITDKQNINGTAAFVRLQYLVRWGKAGKCKNKANVEDAQAYLSALQLARELYFYFFSMEYHSHQTMPIS
jgi:hypothetical protein